MKKSLLKILCIIIAATLIFSLSACGGTKTTDSSKSVATSSDSSTTAPAKPVTLKLWHQWSAPGDPLTTTFSAVVDNWNKQNPNITVEPDAIDGESYKTKIKTAIAANEAPDIFYAWGAGFSKPFVDAGAVLALDQYLADGTMDKLLGGTLTNFTFDGKVYGLPCMSAVAGLYCNKELFDNNGIKIPTTFDELIEASKAFRSKGITPISVGEKDRWPGMYWYDILAERAAGAQACLDALDKKASFDQQSFKDAAAKLCELANAKAFNDSMFAIGYNDMVADFTNGKAAMLYQGNWVGGACDDDKSLVKGKIIVIPFPTLKDGAGNADEFFGGSIDGLWVSNKTQYKDEAVKALKFITENASNGFYAVGSGLPAWKVSGVDETKLSDLTKQTSAMIANSKAYVIWWDTIMDGSSAETHKNLVAELFAGKKTPDEFAKEMQKLNETK